MEMGHPQLPTPKKYNNSTLMGIANNSIQHQQLQSMEMCFFWLADAVEAGKFDI
jgi:hypothetical protein